MNPVAFATSARLSSDADTKVRNIAIRVSTSLWVVERDASRLQCSVARRSGCAARGRSGPHRRRSVPGAAEAVIEPCGHHAPGAHRRHSIHAEGWSDAHPASRRRRPRRPGARPEPRGVRARGRPPRPPTPRAPTPRWRARPAGRCRRPSRSAATSTPTPTVTFPAPLSVTATQRTVVIEGDGTEVQDGALAQVHFTLYNGETGDALDARPSYDPVDARPGHRRRGSRSCRGSCKTLRCSTVGSRIVGVVPAADGVRRRRATPTSASGPASRVVFVLDLVGVVADAGRGRLEPASRRLPRGHLGRRRQADRHCPQGRRSRRAAARHPEEG